MGYNPEAKELDAETLHKFIYGGHVADYMNEMQVKLLTVSADGQRLITHQFEPDCIICRGMVDLRDMLLRLGWGVRVSCRRHVRCKVVFCWGLSSSYMSRVT